MPEEARRARRGPKPNPSRGTPTGYRIAGRTREIANEPCKGLQATTADVAPAPNRTQSGPRTETAPDVPNDRGRGRRAPVGSSSSKGAAHPSDPGGLLAYISMHVGEKRYACLCLTHAVKPLFTGFS
jgi:hypothetical protein